MADRAESAPDMRIHFTLGSLFKEAGGSLNLEIHSQPQLSGQP